MADENKEKEVVEDNNKNEDKEVENTVDAKPVETENGALADLANQIKSLKQEIIDYVDLKFASTPIAKVEKTVDEKDKKLPVW